MNPDTFDEVSPSTTKDIPSPSKEKPHDRKIGDQPLVRLSKSLSWLLRHGAVESEVKLSADGYARINDIMKLPIFKGYTLEDVRVVVANDKKTRFKLKEENGIVLICANQGHSIPIENLQLQPIISVDDCPQAIHGTFHRFWDSIRQKGLLPMSRNHIHFSKEEPLSDRTVSGIRPSCDILIYLDVRKVLADNIPLFESANGVILSPGNGSGRISSDYFLKVIDRKTGQKMKAK